MTLLGGLVEDRVRVFRRGCDVGLRTESLPEEGETILGQSSALLTVPAESAEGEHPRRLQGNVLVALSSLEGFPLRSEALVLPQDLSGQS